MLVCINDETASKPKIATFDMACMLDYINKETTRANRNKRPMQWPICWTLLIMKQPEQGKTTRLLHGLYAGIYL